MTKELNKLHKLEENAQTLQSQILKEFISKTKNNTIRKFLEDLSDRQFNVPKINNVLYAIEDEKLYSLDIGTQVSNDFNREFAYYHVTSYDKDVLRKLIFTINGDIIEDIQYDTE